MSGVHYMQVRELGNPGRVYAQLMDLAQGLAARGLVHCDFNEFNILVRCCATCARHSGSSGKAQAV